MSHTLTTVREPGWLRAIDKLNYVLAVIGGIGGALLVLNIVASVVTRFFTGRPLPSTLDISTYIWMPLVAVLGMGLALKKSEHITVSLIVSPASPRVRRIVEICSTSVTSAMLILLAWASFEGAAAQATTGETAMTSPWLSIWPMRFVVAIGITAFALQAIAALYRAITTPQFTLDEEDDL